MNKPFYIFLFTLLFCCEAKTQTEYITNGSFEQIDSCYGNASPIGFDVFEWSGCAGWSNPIKSSSDLWCDNPKMGIITPPNILGVGYQKSRTGNNFAGILVSDGIVRNYREYIENKLTTTLRKGKRYLLSFYISSTNTDCSPNQFGIKFYNSKFQDNSKLWLTELMPDAINNYNIYISDTLNWQLIEIPFIGNGFENYMLLGNYDDSTKINYSLPCDTSFWGTNIYAGNYFFIDDVSIKEAEALSPIIPNVFSPNNDGINDIWRCDFTAFENINCSIYNRWGNLIFSTNKNNIIWDGRTTTSINCVDGIYFYCIETETEKYKGHIQLVR